MRAESAKGARCRIVPDALRARAARAPNQVALEVDGGRALGLSFGEWDARSNRLARALVGLGVSPGDRVLLRASNAELPEYGVGYFAIQKAGGVVVPVNTRLAPREVERIAAHAEPRLVLDAHDGHRVGDRDWHGVEAAHSAEPIQIERVEDDLADILYTSGTTGAPKGVASAHRDVAALAANKAVRMFEGATFFHAFPPYTFAGTHGMMMMALAGGMSTIVPAKFDGARALAILEERRVSIAYLAPAMLRLMLASGARHDTSSLRLLLYGSAATPPKLVRRLAEAFPTAMQVNVYGLTEGGAASCSLRPEDALQRPGSIGKPNAPAEVSVRDEGGGEVPAGERGEIWLRLPHSKRHYFRDEAATRATWTEDGWLKTGDVGHVDADGFLYLDDRKNDVIIRGGHNVYPAEIEAVLLEHPAVAEAAAVGMAHDILGEDVAAFVAPRDGEVIDVDDLRAFVAERIADYKVPRRITVLADLPKNAMGKVLRRELRDQVQRESE